MVDDSDKNERAIDAFHDMLARLPYHDALALSERLKEHPEIAKLIEPLFLRKYYAMERGDTQELKRILKEEEEIFGQAILDLPSELKKRGESKP